MAGRVGVTTHHPIDPTRWTNVFLDVPDDEEDFPTLAHVERKFGLPAPRGTVLTSTIGGDEGGGGSTSNLPVFESFDAAVSAGLSGGDTSSDSGPGPGGDASGATGDAGTSDGSGVGAY